MSWGIVFLDFGVDKDIEDKEKYKRIKQFLV